MNLKFHIMGLDLIQSRLNELKKNVYVSYDKLFDTSFMKKYTKFKTFNEFLKSGDFIINSIEDFKAIPDDKMDSYVNKSSIFSSWQDMLNCAARNYTLVKLFIDQDKDRNHI